MRCGQLGFLAVLSLIGCNQVLGIETATLASTDSTGRKSCVLNSHCASSEVCIFRVCSPPCDRDRDCNGELRCLRTQAVAACVNPKDSVCRADSECPAGTACNSGVCSTLCSVGSAQSCLAEQQCIQGICRSKEQLDGGLALDSGQGPIDASVAADAADAHARGDAGIPPSCIAGEKRCEQGALQTCRNDRQWNEGTLCAYVCIDGACQGSCVPGDHQCSELQLKRCNERGAWESELTCPKVCTPQGCVDRCTTGQKQCAQSDLLVCTNAGVFAKDKPCDYVCSAGACIGQCVPDDVTCKDSTSTKVCDANGDWQPGASCDFVCAGNACGGECKPGTAQCLDPHQIKRCAGDGSWSAAEACSGQACMANACVGVCSPGASRCKPGSATTREICGNDGQWGSPSDCANVCDGASGQCGGACRPSRTQCADNGHVQTCDSTGQWGSPSACQYICDTQSGQCGGQCVPGSYVCVDAAPASSASHYCNAGTLMLNRSCNYPSELCALGQCASNNSYPVGFATKLATSSSTSANLLLGIPVVIGRRATLLNFGLYGRAKAGIKVKMALYDSDNAGAPRQFLTSSDEADLIEGVIRPPLQIAQTLNPGTYWVMAIYNGTGGNMYIASPGTGRALYVTQDYLTPYPAQFPTSGVTALMNYDLNLFLDVRNSL